MTIETYDIILELDFFIDCLKRFFRGHNKSFFRRKMEQIESRLSDMTIVSNDETKWGWSLTDLYRNALSFYKGDSFFFNN